MRFHMDGVHIDADVSMPADATGIVLFVHGSGSSRHSPRNQFVAGKLRSQGFGTVLMDLLTRSRRARRSVQRPSAFRHCLSRAPRDGGRRPSA